MRRLKAWAILAVGLGALAASGCAERDLSKPPRIRYGSDVCAQCRMIIQDERFAASASADGHFQKFDDIGCLAAHTGFLRAWVHDAATGGWLEIEKAKFTYSRDFVTPMGHGFAAFATAGDAAKWAQDKAGRVITWKELEEIIRKNGRKSNEEHL